MTSTTAGMMKLCQHCGMSHQGNCPRIKAIEYHPFGGVKRIEYWGTHEAIQQASRSQGMAAGSKEST